MLPVLLATVVALACLVAAWYADQYLLRCGTPARAAIAVGLLAGSSWWVTGIETSLWLGAPAQGRPVLPDVGQWGLILIALGFMGALATLAATVVALFRPSAVPRWRRCVLPALALAVHVAAFELLGGYSRIG